MRINPHDIERERSQSIWPRQLVGWGCHLVRWESCKRIGPGRLHSRIKSVVHLYSKSSARSNWRNNIKFSKYLRNYTNDVECWLQYDCGWRQRTFCDFTPSQYVLTEVGVLPFAGDHHPVWTSFCAGSWLRFILCPSSLLHITEEPVTTGWAP